MADGKRHKTNKEHDLPIQVTIGPCLLESQSYPLANYPNPPTRSIPQPLPFLHPEPPPRVPLVWCNTRRLERQRLERESRKKDMAVRRAYFDRLLLEEGKSAEAQERERVEALWDEAEQHAGRKGGDFSLAWQQVPSVSEEHIFGFHERHGGTRVRVRPPVTAPRSFRRVAETVASDELWLVPVCNLNLSRGISYVR